MPELPGGARGSVARWLLPPQARQLRHRTHPGLVVLTDNGYHGAGDHIRTPYKGRNKPASAKAANSAHAKLRSLGERAQRPAQDLARAAGTPLLPVARRELAKAIRVLQARETAG
jgi:hypothetical protein